MRTAILAVLGLAACGIGAGAEPPAYPSATPVRHNSLKVCNQQADGKKLTGATRTQFIKHCQSETVSAPPPAAGLSPAAQATR